MSRAWDVEKIIRRVEARLRRRNIVGVVEQGEAVGLNRETLRRTLRRETSPQQKTIDAMLAFLGQPEKGAERDDGIRFAVERVQEVLDELMELTRSPEDMAEGGKHYDQRERGKKRGAG